MESVSDPCEFGPYLSNRQWGTVREDKSLDGNCWEDFSYEDSLWRVYKSGEDGLMGICDKNGVVCASLALWNYRDPHLKERLYGMSGPQGNHGEDVKELYFYLDNVPDHSYMKGLYKYPQNSFPYKDILTTSLSQTAEEKEFEILDTGHFDEKKYWDVFVEYGKSSSGALCCRYTIINNSEEERDIAVLPQFWFRKCAAELEEMHVFKMENGAINCCCVLGDFVICGDQQTIKPEVLFTNNEDVTCPSLHQDSEEHYLKDAFHHFVCHGDESKINKNGQGTKCGMLYKLKIPSKGKKEVHWCILLKKNKEMMTNGVEEFCGEVLQQQQQKADSFYEQLFLSLNLDVEEACITRQACAGLLWNKQLYIYNVKNSCQQIQSHFDAKGKESLDDIEGNQNKMKSNDKEESKSEGEEKRDKKEPDGLDANSEVSENMGSLEDVENLEEIDHYRKQITNILFPYLSELDEEINQKIIESEEKADELADTQNDADEIAGNKEESEDCTVEEDPIPDDTVDDFIAFKKPFSNKEEQEELGDEMELNGGGNNDIDNQNSLEDSPDKNPDEEKEIDTEGREENKEEKEDETVPHLWNPNWDHFDASDILSMPDKWEFPWFASWDTCFQMIPYSRLDSDFSKRQLLLLLSDRYMHPEGKIPGCEFEFDAMNPPLIAWSCLNIFWKEEEKDTSFLEKALPGLIKNYIWMITNHQREDSRLFNGGFLGMDNISAIDRSGYIPENVKVEQSDATGWMALFSLNLAEMYLHLDNEEESLKYFQSFMQIAKDLNRPIENDGLWCEEDNFFYDVVVYENKRIPVKLRSYVGLVPLTACMMLPTSFLENKPKISEYFNKSCREDNSHVVQVEEGYFLSAVPLSRLHKIMIWVLNENEFASKYGIRSLSKYYENNPYIFELGEKKAKICYCPGESLSQMFGGNSNWRGPVWFPVNYILVKSFLQYHQAVLGPILPQPCVNELNFSQELQEYCKDSITMTTQSSFLDVALHFCQALVNLFLMKDGIRPLHGKDSIYCKESSWQDLLLFYEYFHGDTGRGCGASHQTGWTSLVLEFLAILKENTA